MNLKQGDLVFVRSKGWVSNMIVHVSTGDKNTDAPSHVGMISNFVTEEIIEVVFGGKRKVHLDIYKDVPRLWIKRLDLTREEAADIVSYLLNKKVAGYDWRLIVGFGLRFALRKVFGWSRWNWVTNKLDSRINFVCSEFINSGLNSEGVGIQDKCPTPWDLYRKLKTEDVDPLTA